MTAETHVHIYATPAGVLERAARTFLDVCEENPAGPICVALSGGSTPEGLYRLLATEYRDRVPWERLEVFFGDERCVPPDHEDSNYRMARDVLLSVVPVPLESVHRMRAEEPDLECAARDYEELIRARVPDGPRGVPSFHLVWLGMGADGHTASLFPGTGALEENTRLVVPNPIPALGVTRMTVTLPLIHAARRVQLLVTGGAKADVLEAILAPAASGGAYGQYPAARVASSEGTLEWLVDREAAAKLQGPDWIA